MTGFLTTRKSFSGPLAPRMASLCKSCTIRPLKRLKVRGMRTCGLTSIRTPFAVWMYTWSRPALFSGESSKVSKHCASISYWLLKKYIDLRT